MTSGYWFKMWVCLLALNAAAPAFSQDRDPTQATTAVEQSGSPAGGTSISTVPRLVRFSGTVRDRIGKTEAGLVTLDFALYEEQEGGTPLWVEAQQVQLDDKGRYTVLLGATQPDGLPLDLFVSGRARWLAIKLDLPGGEEQPRILLVGVPYALKAADADTLGGKPSSAFVLAGVPPVPSGQAAGVASSPPGGAPLSAPPPFPSSLSSGLTSVGGSGTANYVPLWTSSSNLGNSVIYQTSGKVGIGTTTPAVALDVNGNAFVRGTLYPRCIENICFADRFPGSDIGTKINAAYAALPPSGGIIQVLNGGSFSTPIVFGTLNKPVVLTGVPGNGLGGTRLAFTPTSGTAITVNWGGPALPGAGIRDMVVEGNGGTSVGILLGGSNGAIDAAISNVLVQTFGVNLEIGTNTYLDHFEHCHLRAGAINNLLIPAGSWIENASFDHCIFADSPSPYTNGVVINAQGDYEFTDCSFDQSQIVIGNNAIVKIKGGHVENPARGAPYDFIDFSGNTLDLIGTDILNLLVPPQPGPAETINISGGNGAVVLSASEYYGTDPQTSFIRIAPGANPNIYVYGHHDSSGAYTGPFVSGTTSGTIALFPDPAYKNLFFSGIATASGASPGNHGAPPGQVAGYLIVNIGGTHFKIPYYNN